MVQQVRLVLNSKDWQALKDGYRENTYFPADLHWNGMVVRNIGIRSRGGGSRSPTKPGLRLDFDRYATTQKFLGLKSLVLDNLAQDLPMMRERLAMTFLAKMGRPAPRVVHAGLWVNGDFCGVYTIVESIDKDFLERTLGEDDGYLYEYNNVAGWYFTRSEGVPFTLDNLARIFEPKTRESDPLDAADGAGSRHAQRPESRVGLRRHAWRGISTWRTSCATSPRSTSWPSTTGCSATTA